MALYSLFTRPRGSKGKWVRLMLAHGEAPAYPKADAVRIYQGLLLAHATGMREGAAELRRVD